MATEWKFERIAGPFNGATEGAVWDAKAILFSVPAENRILRYEPLSGNVTEFRKFTNRTKGLACSADGVLYGCQSGSRRVVRLTRTAPDLRLPTDWTVTFITTPTIWLSTRKDASGLPIAMIPFLPLARSFKDLSIMLPSCF
jgi:hypothetical protein